MSYDTCEICGTKMTGFTTLFCPKEDEHPNQRKSIACANYENRSNWPRGPWDLECDYRKWLYKGLTCVIRRHTYFGTWNGYVQIPRTHSWHRLNDTPRVCAVHGGVTFYGELQTEDGWWIGFDCGHYLDLSPRDVFFNPGAVYRNEEYVIAECEKLADAVKEVK